MFERLRCLPPRLTRGRRRRRRVMERTIVLGGRGEASSVPRRARNECRDISRVPRCFRGNQRSRIYNNRCRRSVGREAVPFCIGARRIFSVRGRSYRSETLNSLSNGRKVPGTKVMGPNSRLRSEKFISPFDYSRARCLIAQSRDIIPSGEGTQ